MPENFNYIGTGLGVVTLGLETGMDLPSLVNVLDTDTLGGKTGLYCPSGSSPVPKVLTEEDNKDGTGTVITRDQEIGGVVDTIYASRAGSGDIFASYGFTWDENNMALDITDLGTYFVFCRSVGGDGSTDSLMIRAPISDVGDDTGNIPFVRRAMRQAAVYWAPQSTFDEYGNPTFDAPIQIACRWEDNLMEIVNSDGTTQMSKAQIYTDRVVQRAGVLMKGVMDDVLDYVNPNENVNAEEILEFKEMPNLRKTGYLRIAYL